MSGTLQLSAMIDPATLQVASGIAVRIEKITVDEGQDQPSWTVLVPTDPRGLSVEVPAGTYRIQAWLPTGEILLRGAIVEEGHSSRVAFKAAARPSSTGGAATGTQGTSQIDLTKEFHPLEFQPAFTTDSTEFLDSTHLEAVELCVDDPSILSWARASDGDVGRQFEDLGDQIVQLDRSTSSISISSFPTAVPELGDRWWIRFRHSSGMSIGTLPVQWLSNNATGPKRSEIDVRFETAHQRLEVAIRDADLDALLAYLRLGRLSAAEMAVDALSREGVILNALREKRANPLAACAAAYVSLATANRTQLDHWRAWTVNLMDWFPWVPDGAIIRACVLMDGPISSGTKLEILDAAKSSFRRGLPYFSVGLKHLREIFTIFGTDDAEAVRMLNSVREISSRCDISETFTTLQFPSH